MSVCSFCGKDQKDVGLLILGPNGANICNACVKLCYNLILDADKKDDVSKNSQTVTVTIFPSAQSQPSGGAAA